MLVCSIGILRHAISTRSTVATGRITSFPTRGTFLPRYPLAMLKEVIRDALDMASTSRRAGQAGSDIAFAHEST